MKMKTKTMAMFALLMIVLSIVGVTYATWSDYVQIEGTVNMNDFLFGILDVKCIGDNEDDLPIPKDIGWCEYWLWEPEDSVHHDPPQTVYHLMEIKVHDAYPSYEQFIVFNLKNAGTTPAHIVTLDIYDPTGELEFEDEAVLDDGEGVFWKDFDGDGIRDPAGDEDIINILIKKAFWMPPGPYCGEWWADGDLVCNQIDPCEEEPAILIMHFKEPAEECHEYFFKIYIEAIQWNKV